MSYILIVEDDEATSLLLKTYLSDADLPVIIAETSHEALDVIKKDEPEVILLDLNLPDINGLDFIKNIIEYTKNAEIIVVTGEKGAEKALTAINAGAKDYMVKPVDKKRLLTTVTNSLERIELNRQIELLQTDQKSDQPLSQIIGASKTIKELHKIINQASKTTEPVLIWGERGTGKLLAAKTIHRLRNHADEQFNQINCALFPEDNEEGFIQAISKPSDTIFLRNLPDLPDKLQRLLLGMIDEGNLPQVIWSCDTDPVITIREQKLRDDLFYRLNVVQIKVAALREREKDIIILADHFLRQHTKKEKKIFEDFTPKALDAFINYHWPGNILELSNIIKNIIIVNNDTKYIDIDLLPKHLLNETPASGLTDDISDTEIDTIESLFRGESIIPIRDLEEMAIRHALKICEGNIQKAATNLKISPATLYRKKPPVH